MKQSRYKNSLRYAAASAIVLLLSFGFSGQTQAQFSDMGAMIKAGKADASILTREYLMPFGEGIGSVTNTGWTNRANTHRKLGFDIQIRAAAAMVPDNRRGFIVDPEVLGLEATRPMDSDNTFTPTISGASNTGAHVGIYDNEDRLVTDFNLPQGTGFPYIPSPMVNVSLGILFDTDVMVRFIPTTDLPGVNGSVSLRGAGLKHGLNQYIPAGGLLPVDLSVMAAFTNFQIEADPKVRLHSDDDRDFDQQVIFSANSFNINALVGRNLPFISVFAGVGLETSSTTFEANGTYPVYEYNQLGFRQEVQLEDPVGIAFDNSNSLRAMAGVRFSLLILDIFADATYSNYPVINAGFGISFR